MKKQKVKIKKIIIQLIAKKIKNSLKRKTLICKVGAMMKPFYKELKKMYNIKDWILIQVVVLAQARIPVLPRKILILQIIKDIKKDHDLSRNLDEIYILFKFI